MRTLCPHPNTLASLRMPTAVAAVATSRRSERFDAFCHEDENNRFVWSGRPFLLSLSSRLCMFLRCWGVIVCILARLLILCNGNRRGWRSLDFSSNH